MCVLSVWEAVRFGPNLGPIVSDYKRPCWFLPYLFSLSLGHLGRQDMGNKPPEATHVDGRNILFLRQKEFNWGCRAQLCPKPKVSLFQDQNMDAGGQPATIVIVRQFLVDGAVLTLYYQPWRRFYQSNLPRSFVQQAEPEGLCYKDNRIISPVFMDISVSRRLSHILCRRGVDIVDRRGSPCDAFDQVTVQWHWVVPSPLSTSAPLPLSYKHLSLCVVLAAMSFSQHLARRGWEEGREREKRRLFPAANDGRFIKRAKAFWEAGPSTLPPPCASGSLSRGVGSKPPHHHLSQPSALSL